MSWYWLLGESVAPCVPVVKSCTIIYQLTLYFMFNLPCAFLVYHDYSEFSQDASGIGCETVTVQYGRERFDEQIVFSYIILNNRLIVLETSEINHVA